MIPDLGSLALNIRGNAWGLLWPELVLVGLSLLFILIEVLAPGFSRRYLTRLAVLSQLALVLGFAWWVFSGQRTAEVSGFNGLVAFSHFGDLARLFFLSCSLLTCHLGTLYLRKRQLPALEFFVIVPLVSVGLMLLVQSTDFVMAFVALEAVTIGFYVLVSYCRHDPLTLEAGLKYLVQGALSSAILLFGIVLVYGSVGSSSFEYAGSSLTYGNVADYFAFLGGQPTNLIAITGALLVLAGVLFKVGAVPFQIWIPDVYQGAPTPVTAFLAVASKAGGVLLLANLLTGPFAALSYLTVPLFSAVAIATILFGNLTALGQRNVKRLMGLSGVAHAGYLLLGVVAWIVLPREGLATVDQAFARTAVLVYLVAYLFASYGVFYVMGLVAGEDDPLQRLEDYADLLRKRSLPAWALAAGLGSLAGVPPLAGFIGKVLLFVAAFQAGLYWPLGAAVLGATLGIYYYFGWMRFAFLPPDFTDEPTGRDPAPYTVGVRLALFVLTLATVLFGFNQVLLQGLFPG